MSCPLAPYCAQRLVCLALENAARMFAAAPDSIVREAAQQIGTEVVPQLAKVPAMPLCQACPYRSD